MRITSKGQVTIPQQIREQAGLLPGTEVEFEIVKGKVVLRPATTSATPGWQAIMRSKGTANHPEFKGWTTDRIMRLLRGEG